MPLTTIRFFRTLRGAVALAATLSCLGLTAPLPAQAQQGLFAPAMHRERQGHHHLRAGAARAGCSRVLNAPGNPAQPRARATDRRPAAHAGRRAGRHRPDRRGSADRDGGIRGPRQPAAREEFVQRARRSPASPSRLSAISSAPAWPGGCWCRPSASGRAPRSPKPRSTARCPRARTARATSASAVRDHHACPARPRPRPCAPAPTDLATDTSEARSRPRRASFRHSHARQWAGACPGRTFQRPAAGAAADRARACARAR